MATSLRPKPRIGRPRREFNQAVADRICEHLINGKSLRRICLYKDMPSLTIVMKWLRENPSFQQQYARAREEQADGYADELMELGKQATAENAHAIRVRVDIIKWICSKLKPRAYGDRLELGGQAATVNVAVNSGPVNITDLTRDLQFLLLETARAEAIAAGREPPTKLLLEGESQRLDEPVERQIGGFERVAEDHPQQPRAIDNVLQENRRAEFAAAIDPKPEPEYFTDDDGRRWVSREAFESALRQELREDALERARIERKVRAISNPMQMSCGGPTPLSARIRSSRKPWE